MHQVILALRRASIGLWDSYDFYLERNYRKTRIKPNYGIFNKRLNDCSSSTLQCKNSTYSLSLQSLFSKKKP